MKRALLTLLLLSAACGRLGFDSLDSDDGGITSGVDADTGQVVTTIEGPGSWAPVGTGPLANRLWTAAIWTGSEFIVYGGALDNFPYENPSNTGARYNPTTGEWAELSTTDAPRRHTPLLVWTGEYMVMYAGGWGLGPMDGGARYHPPSDTWTALPVHEPEIRRIYGRATAVGSRMMVWGGWANAPGQLREGLLYDPANNEWSQVTEEGAPEARSLQTLVWTGTDVIVWGGCTGDFPNCPGLLGDGALYDPSNDSWRPMSGAGAPQARYDHSSVWTGSELIIFGGATEGSEGSPTSTGAIYNPSTDSWRPMTTAGAPSPRLDHAAGWVGDKMLVWGGLNDEADGFLYDPEADEWSAMSIDNAPANRGRFAFATSGQQLFIFGGSIADSSGSVWSPAIP